MPLWFKSFNRFNMSSFNGYELLRKAKRDADAIEKGLVEEKVPEETKVKRFTIYTRFGRYEKPVAFGLYAGEIDVVIAVARRHIVRKTGGVQEGPLFEATTVFAREEI